MGLLGCQFAGHGSITALTSRRWMVHGCVRIVDQMGMRSMDTKLWRRKSKGDQY